MPDATQERLKTLAKARNVSVNQLLFRTLSGSGSVTYNTALSPALPIAIGDLAATVGNTKQFALM